MAWEHPNEDATMRPLLCIVLYSILLSYKGCSQASRFCRFISWTRSRFTPTLFKPWTANINILDVVAYIDAANTNIRKFKRKYLSQMIDFTAGASQLSMPYAETVSNMSIATVSSQQSIDGSTITTTPTKISPLLRIHQLSKKVIKKVPDNILLGILVLISSELLQREVSSKSSIIPPLLQSVANTTIFELDTKLELLSELQWDFDPFIQAEVERLQTQPLEAIDRFLVTDVLPKVDRELSPILSKLIADPAKAKVVTNNIKEIIQITTFLVLRPTKSSSKSQTIQDKILESVDVVGKNIEDGKIYYV